MTVVADTSPSARAARRTARRRPPGHAPDEVTDRGFTLVEMIITVVITGLVVGAVAASVGVIIRNEGQVVRQTAQSNDVQQIVNYLAGDVLVAGPDPANYRTGGSPDCASGDNVLSITYDGDRAVSYVSTIESQAITLHRHECIGTARRSARVASTIDHTAGVQAEIILGLGGVERVELVVHQGGQQPTVLAASPRLAEAPPAPTPGTPGTPGSPGTGECTTDNPVAATLGFNAFVEQDAHLVNTHVYRAIGVGGSLSFSGVEVHRNGNQNAGDQHGVSVYAQRIDWDATGGKLRVNGRDARIAETDNLNVLPPTNMTWIYPAGLSSGPRNIEIQNGQLRPITQPSEQIDFATQFAALRACSAMMAALPDSCPGCAEHINPLNGNGNGPFPGSGHLTIGWTSGVTNVLNVRADQLQQISSNVPNWSGGQPGQHQPLIINVIAADGHDVVHLSPIQFSNHPTTVLWNFYGVTELHLTGGVWGTVFAPDAHVTSSGDIRGSLVARSLTQTGGVVDDDRRFVGEIGW